jgi:hypothetical protein
LLKKSQKAAFSYNYTLKIKVFFISYQYTQKP